MRLEVKKKVIRALVWPVLMYGAEAWVIKAADARALEAFEMWTYRRMLRISWRDRRTNASVLSQINTNMELLQLVKKRKLVFFGHLCRGSGVARQIVTGVHPGRKRRGRPRRQYADDIKDWINATLEEAIRMTEDRKRWRDRVAAVVVQGTGRPST